MVGGAAPEERERLGRIGSRQSVEESHGVPFGGGTSRTGHAGTAAREAAVSRMSLQGSPK
ncbi:hypothetical protein GCM10025867_11430 [Frondihabitans sucicola]|uniref:Uncharacterized protein n=1 Tax=Frondihabitans sucicola TaxID=1268041 RepID=A0ABM8GKJ9_9MICO|nr:hypothetical protein GCM10025867_11430 [Frondihabitans sucicola]